MGEVSWMPMYYGQSIQNISCSKGFKNLLHLSTNLATLSPRTVALSNFFLSLHCVAPDECQHLRRRLSVYEHDMHSKQIQELSKCLVLSSVLCLTFSQKRQREIFKSTQPRPSSPLIKSFLKLPLSERSFRPSPNTLKLVLLLIYASIPSLCIKDLIITCSVGALQNFISTVRN